MAASEKWAERIFQFVEGSLRKGPGRFLDIACGLGNTVSLFGRKGWDAHGIDADPNTKEFHERLGIRTTIGQIENLDPGTKYDLISIAHAIYFISNPREFVRKIHGMLSENGLFLVVVSDVLASTNPARPSLALTWEPTLRSLKYFLQMEGFHVLKTTTIKGSSFVLARPGPTRRCHAMPILAYLQHATHEWRYLIYGRFIVKGRAIAKKVKSAILG
jgi:SAM-dependent methyltransferase